MSKNEPIILRYSLKNAFSFCELLLIWIIVLILPLGTFLYFFEKISKTNNDNLVALYRNNLQEEMKDFKRCLKPETFIAEKLKLIDHSFGYVSIAKKTKSHKWPSFSKKFLHKLKTAIEKELDCPVFGIFLYGPDGKDWLCHFADSEIQKIVENNPNLSHFPAYISGQFSHRMKAIKYKKWQKELHKKKKNISFKSFIQLQQNNFKKVFGEYFYPVPSNKKLFSFFSKKWGKNIFYAYNSIARLNPKDNLWMNYGGYFLLISCRDIKPQTLLNWAKSSIKTPGLHREILFEHKIKKPQYVETPSRLYFLDTMPMHAVVFLSLTQNAYYRQSMIPVNTSKNVIPTLQVFVPKKFFKNQITTLLQISKIVITFIVVVSGIWLVMGLYKEWKIPFLLRGKVLIGVGYSLFIPIFGCYLGIIGVKHLYEKIAPEEIMDKLTRKLAILENSMDTFEYFLSSRLHNLRSRLETIKESSFSAIKLETERWMNEGRKIYLSDFDPLKNFVKEKVSKHHVPLPENVKLEIIDFIRDNYPRRNNLSLSSFSEMFSIIENEKDLSKIDNQLIKKLLCDWHNISICPRWLFLLHFSSNNEIFFHEQEPQKFKEDYNAFFERSISMARLLAMGGLDGLTPSQIAKEEAKVALIHTLLDPHLGQSWMNDFFVRDGVFLRLPVATIYDKFCAFPIKISHQKHPVGFLVARYFIDQMAKNCLEVMAAHSNSFVDKWNNVNANFAIFLRSKTNPESLEKQYWTTNLRGDKEVRKKAEESAFAFSERRWNLLNSKENALYVSRYFKNFPNLGIGKAELTSSKAAWHSASFILLLMHSIAVVLFISYLLSTYLSAPILVFANMAKALSKGIFNVQVQTIQKNEIGHTAELLNKMATGLLERKRLSRFISQEVDRVVSDHSGVTFNQKGNLIEATILFSHIQDFISLVEQREPEEIVQLLNNYFTVMEECIIKNGGTIDKLIGDAIMAVFFDLSDSEKHSYRACKAALEMRNKLTEFNAERRKAESFEIETGIGIATGTVISGQIGSASGRLDYTVIGNPVNLAARLESHSYKGKYSRIILAPTTIKHLKGRCRLSFIERTFIKGRSRTFPLYELIQLY